MASDQAKQLLQQGIAAAKAGQQAQARQILQEAVRSDPRSESAWLWLSSVAKDNAERIFCLKQLLSLNPNNENAIKGLKQLGVVVEAGTPPPPPKAGIPQIDPQKLNASMSQLDPILQRYQPIPSASLPFTWAKKRGGRVGDSSAMLLRIGVIAGAAVLVVAILGGLLFVVSNVLQAGPVALLGSTPTLTPRPTLTPTSTPGATDTPSPTPKATLPPSATPAKVQPGSIYNRQPTPLYPKANDSIIADAMALAGDGQTDAAITKLESEQKALQAVKGADYDTVNYYLALLYANSGNPDRAQGLLEDSNNKSDSAFYHAAHAYILSIKGQTQQAQQEADQAFKTDPSLVLAAVTDAQTIELLDPKKIPQARAILNQALSVPGQEGNTLLLTARGNTFLAEGNFQGAISDAQLALYADPLSESAYILNCKALLTTAAAVQARDARIQAYGTAVLAAKAFLFYYPNETLAWVMLGQAREGEENYADAVTAFSQAVVVDQKSPEAQTAFQERGKMYLTENRYQDAYDDFDKALSIQDTPDARRGRLEAALALKNYSAASEDATVLLKANPTDSSLILTQTELLLRLQKFDDASALLTDQFINSLNANDKARAQLYHGVARYQSTVANANLSSVQQGNFYQAAFTDLTESLVITDTGMGHYYRGLSLQALQQPQEAIPDYEWVVYWNQVYNYDFGADAAKRLDALAPPKPGTKPTATRTPFPTRTPTATPVATQAPTFAVTEASTEQPTPESSQAATEATTAATIAATDAESSTATSSPTTGS